MQEAEGTSVLGDFDDASFTYNGTTSRFFQRDAGFWVRTDGPDGRLDDYRVRYTFGVSPLQQYLIEFPDGRLQALSIAWDSRPREQGGSRWFHLYPDERVDFRDELHWTKRLQNWNYMCADCHSTNLRKGYDGANDRFRTTWSEMSVGCEACHGPGSPHVQWAGTPDWLRGVRWKDNGLSAPLAERKAVTWATDPATKKPVRSTPKTTSRELDVCAPCHSRRTQLAEGSSAGSTLADFYAVSTLAAGLYHADGQQLDEVYTYGSFVQSRMHAAGVTCSDCHDPHTAGLRLGGNALCTRCHSAPAYDSRSHHFHPAAAGDAATACVSCHMPQRTYMGIDARRDHSLRVPRPDRTTALGVPNACSSCHSKETAQWAAVTIQRWYGRNAAGFQRFAEAFSNHDRQAAGPTEAVEAIVTDASHPPIVRASALERLAASPSAGTLAAAATGFADADPAVRRSALSIFDGVPPRDRLVALPLVADATRSVRVEAARVLSPAAALIVGLDERRLFDRAANEFIEFQRLHADRPESRTNLGTFFLELGRTGEATAEYLAAIRLDSQYVPAYVNLADAQSRSGQESAAEATIRQGLTQSAANADLRHALGLSLARANRYEEALGELARAAELRPDVARFSYAQAVALHSTGRTSEAIAVLEAARSRHPRDRDLLFALSTFHRDLGQMPGARAAAGELRRLFPGDEEAAALDASLSSASAR